jgi:hypothetical protein
MSTFLLCNEFEQPSHHPRKHKHPRSLGCGKYYITNIDLFWGQVADSYENDSSLTTYRNEVFYTPAGASDVWGVPAAGQPSTIPSVAWNKVYSSPGIDISGFDYSGRSNIALGKVCTPLIL